ncbi:MAG: family 10 glycosylhydrolase [Ignavibacteriales bacterium]
MRKLFFLFFLFMIMFTNCKNQTRKIEAVRGVWLTNVDSDVLKSKKTIEEAVTLCDEIGLNSIFVVTWNKGMTTYPSKIMSDFTGVAIDTQFIGRDPLKELIEAAHKKNIKVIAWFEFGFASSYNENGGEILKLKPQWASKNFEGKLVSKNNFEWMNGFLPDVQDFMLSLILEVVNNYDIDGIQGDDRLPAMPSEAGYDEFTKSLYAKKYNGDLPPADYKNPEWTRFRAGILTDFMKRIYKEVKAAKPNVLVTMAPSIYPWSLEEYLQDWPTWLMNGSVELIIPQVYRYKISDYEKEINEIKKHQVSEEYFYRFYPGILLMVGDYSPDEKFLAQMIKVNRNYGINGEIFFFYEGLKKHSSLLKKLYAQKAVFPNF